MKLKQIHIEEHWELEGKGFLYSIRQSYKNANYDLEIGDPLPLKYIASFRTIADAREVAELIETLRIK